MSYLRPLAASFLWLAASCRGAGTAAEPGYPTDLVSIATVQNPDSWEPGLRVTRILKEHGIPCFIEVISVGNVMVHQRDGDRALELLWKNRELIGPKIQPYDKPDPVSPTKPGSR